MRYCKKCILPDSRPNIAFDKNGICSGCNSSVKKKNIDWSQRNKEFKLLARDAKNVGSTYDCVIPVSGGKDSTWQVITALENNLKPLCVTWRTPARNKIGQKNLENLISLGVTHIDFTINPEVERIFTYKAYKKFGIPLIPMHMALHAIPLQIAVNFKIPLIIWGENSAFEYGGDDESLKGMQLSRNWLLKYGVTNGTTYQDWVDEDMSVQDLSPYYWPTEEEQIKSGVKAIFLGHFFNWDPSTTYKEAMKYGFEANDAPKTGLYDYADIDDEFLITIHHWMKWYKFGFTRLWDNLSLEIRNNRISRDEAINIIIQTGEEKREDEIEKFCEYLKISTETFFEIANTFRNPKIWVHDNNKYVIKNFLIDNWFK